MIERRMVRDAPFRLSIEKLERQLTEPPTAAIAA